MRVPPGVVMKAAGAKRQRRPGERDQLSRTGEHVRVAREQLERAREHLELARKRLQRARDKDREPT